MKSKRMTAATIIVVLLAMFVVQNDPDFSVLEGFGILAIIFALIGIHQLRHPEK